MPWVGNGKCTSSKTSSVFFAFFQRRINASQRCFVCSFFPITCNELTYEQYWSKINLTCKIGWSIWLIDHRVVIVFLKTSRAIWSILFLHWIDTWCPAHRPLGAPPIKSSIWTGNCLSILAVPPNHKHQLTWLLHESDWFWRRLIHWNGMQT